LKEIDVLYQASALSTRVFGSGHCFLLLLPLLLAHHHVGCCLFHELDENFRSLVVVVGLQPAAIPVTLLL
jgi:hypothetical protein